MLKNRSLISFVFSAICSWAVNSGINDPVNINGDTPLIVAVLKQDLSEVKQLLAQGADPLIAKNDGATPVDFACWGGNTEIRNLLLNHRYDNGDTPLIKAVFRADNQMVRKLLAYGANASLSKSDGANAFDFAAWGNNNYIKELFKKIGPHQCGEATKSLYFYESGKANQYTEMIDYFYRKNTTINIPNKLALISRYKEIWHESYEKNIAGTFLEIFGNLNLDDNKILLQKINPDFFAGVNYQSTPRAYNFKHNEAFIDFANQRLGGGVFGWGFVQEEIELTESTILPWIAELRADESFNSVSWCEGVNLKLLDKEPVVLKFRIFADVDLSKNIVPDLKANIAHGNFSTIYGSKFFDVREDRVASYLNQRKDPIDIYSPAMAAKAFSAGSKYTKEDLETMTLLAARTFYLTMLAQNSRNHPIIIHTGNWGTGAFNNSLKTSWAMQALAMNVAASLFRESYGDANINYQYDAFNDAAEFSVKQARQELFPRLNLTDLTLAQAIEQIFNLSESDSSWQVK